jgi:hypothetical protein
MDNQNTAPAQKAAAAVITTRKSYTLTPPREYDLLDQILAWHIAAQENDGADIRDFNRLIALYDGTLIEREARDYCLAFRDAWLSDRSFSKVSGKQRERCLETFRQLQKEIILNWKTDDWWLDVSALTQAAYYVYSELLNSDLGSEDPRYEMSELYESSDASLVRVFDDDSLVIQDRNNQMTLCMHVGCGVPHLIDHLMEEEQQAV